MGVADAVGTGGGVTGEGTEIWATTGAASGGGEGVCATFGLNATGATEGEVKDEGKEGLALAGVYNQFQKDLVEEYLHSRRDEKSLPPLEQL